MEEKTIEKYYQMRAEELVDAMFDKDYFREDVDRGDMQGVEDLLAFVFKSNVESAIKLNELNKKFKENMVKK